jgi:chromosome segregation ATPase
MTNSYHSLQEDSEKHRRLYEELQNQYRLSEERSEEMAEQLTTLEDEVAKLKATIAESAKVESESQKNLLAVMAEKDQTIERQQEEVSHLSEQVKELQTSLEEKTKETEEAVHERETEAQHNEQLITKLQSTISELSDTLSTMNSENERLAKANEKCKDELSAKTSVISLKDLELRELEGRLASVEEMREQHERIVNELNQQIQQHHHDMEAAAVARELELRQSKQEEFDRTTTTETLLSLQAELSSVSSNLTSSIDEIKHELEMERQSHAQDNKDKDEEVQSLLEKIEKLSQDHTLALHTASEELLIEQQRNSDKDKKIQMLEASLVEVKGELVVQTSSKNETDSALSQMTAQNQDLLIKIQRLEEQRQILEESCNNTSTSMSGQVSDLLKRINELNLSLDASRVELQEQEISSQKNLRQCQAEHLVQVQEIEGKCLELEEKVKSLTDESTSSKLEITVLTEQMALLQAQLQETESLSETQEKELSARQEKLVEVEKRCSDLEASLSEYEMAIAKHSAHIEELIKERDSLIERETELSSQLSQLQLSEEAAITRVSALEAQLMNSRNELEERDAEVAALKIKLAESEERGREGTDGREEQLRTIQTERENERQQYSQERSELLLQIASLERTLEEQRKETEEQREAFEEKINGLLIEKEQLEERVQSQVDSYALLQESFQQISQHDEQLNDRYTELRNEFHEYKIQHSSRHTSPTETTGESGVEFVTSASGKDEIKLNDQLRQKIIFEEENLYLKNQIQLLENDKEENEKTLSSLQEKLNAYQTQLAQRQEVRDESEKNKTADETAEAAAALENSQLEEIRSNVEQLQRENDELISALIETKLKAACHASETDEERKKLFSLKRKLQLYAERVATLEVTVAERMAGNDTNENSEKKFRWGRKK